MNIHLKNKPKIAFVGNLITLPYSPDHSGIIQAFEAMKSKNKISDYFIADCYQHHKLSLDMAETMFLEKPDIIVHGMTDSLSEQWPEKIKAVLPNTIQVMSMWDYRPFDLKYDGLWDRWIKSGPYLDLITLSNKNQLKWWEKSFGVKTIYWPHGCVVKEVEYAQEYDVQTVFTGARNEDHPYNKRVKLIDNINRITPIHWINRSGGDSDEERANVWKDLGKIYYSAKTVLDINHFWDAEGYASGRYFYTSGLGGCAITKRFPGCEELFPEGTKIYFDTPEEAADKIKFYVNNEQERNEIKRKGKEWCNIYHNYTVRFEELFNWLNL